MFYMLYIFGQLRLGMDVRVHAQVNPLRTVSDVKQYKDSKKYEL